MQNHRSTTGGPGDSGNGLQALAQTLKAGSDVEVAAVLFEGWEDSYGGSRSRLLERMDGLRRQLPPAERAAIGQRLFRVLVNVGEELGDMRFVHLAVESRDMLVYGY